MRDASQAGTANAKRVRSPRIGIVGNPRSHAYRALGRADAGGGLFELAEPLTLEGLRAALAGFAANGVDLLVVQGGDGTLRDVLTALPAAYGAAPPALAILPTGNTNLAARVFGGIEPGPRGLSRLAAAALENRLRRTSCRVLRVDWLNGSGRAPLRGFFLGAGLYAEGKRLTDARIHRSGVHNGAAVALAVVLALSGALLGRKGRLREGTERTLVVDDAVTKSGRGFVFLATTLDRLMLGFWPFGAAQAERGAIRWLDLDAPARNLSGTLLRMMVRRVPAIGRRGERQSGRAERIALGLDGPFVLDGEMFEAGPGGILLSDGGVVTIVSA